MQDKLRSIDSLLARNEVKKAEIAIARHLRSPLTELERADTLIYRARARLSGARPADALDDLHAAQSAMIAEFDRPEILELQADCYLARFELASVGFADRQDIVEALQIYKGILNQYPDYLNQGWIYYQLGRIALINNDVDMAQHYFQKSLLTPSHVRAITSYCYERMGFIAFYEQRDLTAARGFLNKAIDTYPVVEDQTWLVQVYILQSRVFKDRHEYKNALLAAEQAVAVASSTGSENRSSRAEALLTAGELMAGFAGRENETIYYLQQFMQYSRKPLGVDVTWSRVHEVLGDSYFQLGQFMLAAEAYEAALQYNPDHPWAISLHYRIAQSYYQQNEYAQTIAAVEHLIAIAASEYEQVSDYRVYDILGNAQFALGNYADAMNSYQQALALAPVKAEGVEKIRQYLRFSQELS